MLFVKDAEFHEEPFAFNHEPGMFTMDEILTIVNVSLSRAFPRWGRRTNVTLTQMHSNGLIYLVEHLNEPENIVADWRYQHFAEIVSRMPSYDAQNMIPILTT